MQVHLFGATRATSWMYLCGINRHRLPLEFGLFQGRRGEPIERYPDLPSGPKQLDAVVLSHCAH